MARAKVQARITRLALGNPGDVAPVGASISEMRIHYGPGYRVYYSESRHQAGPRDREGLEGINEDGHPETNTSERIVLPL
jgi:hypothetical protein